MKQGNLAHLDGSETWPSSWTITEWLRSQLEQTWTNKYPSNSCKLFGNPWLLLSPFPLQSCASAMLCTSGKRGWNLSYEEHRGTWDCVTLQHQRMWHKNILRDWGFCVSTSKKEAPTSSRHHQSIEEQNPVNKSVINNHILSNMVELSQVFETSWDCDAPNVRSCQVSLLKGLSDFDHFIPLRSLRWFVQIMI